ncbi:MAG TPA: EAL domain-containing protein [Steroidobacteraceae bacterium]|nr:EAL domain-containing protein [Steroidobacteraceae bacterium]
MLTVVAVGVLLTAAVSAMVLETASADAQRVRNVLAQAQEVAAADPTAALAIVTDDAMHSIQRIVWRRLPPVIASGLLLTLLAGFVTWRMVLRIDRGVEALMHSAEQIGSGHQAEPVTATGVREISAIEESLERMRQALAQTTISRDYLGIVLNSMSDAVLVTSTDGRVRTANRAATQLLGLGLDRLVGVDLVSLVAEDHRATFDPAKVLAAPGETVLSTARGQTIPVSVSASAISSDDPRFKGSIFVLRDITERKRAERRIRYLARFDTLTKMPNRMQFQHLLHQAITRATRQGRSLALLYVDVDNFKDVNDTFGHDAGDRVLETLAERLSRILPKESVVGRLAGDEFAVFAETPDGEQDRHEQAASLARMLLAEIARAQHVGEHEIEVTASIGIAACPDDGDNVIDLIRNADAAMYHAKRAGRNCHVFYAPEMNAAAVERLLLKGKLRRALGRNEFVLRYQPKVDLASGHVVGAEALLRWRLPGHGEIAPAQFIPLAEESLLIRDIGAWVLNQVCSDYAVWQKRVSDPGIVALNLSLKELSHASFIPRCRSVFQQHGVSPGRVELEITETTLMMDAERTLPLLDELRAMGVHLAIDDFGTGYSSLSALQQFPIGTLKIDQSFVRNAATDPDDATIVRTIIEMGRSLGLQVLAEGIETEEQRAFLLHSGCEYGQGRLFGEPMSADEFLETMVRQATGVHPVLRLPA